MRRTPGDWLLARDSDASPRLDSIRRAVLAPERATLLEAVVEAFRPNLAAWAALALVWLALAAAHLATPPGITPPPNWAGRRQIPSALAASPDEIFSPLDRHS